MNEIITKNKQDSQGSPSWNEIFKEIGVQLKNRSSLLIKRVLLISLPAFIFFILIRYLVNSSGDSSLMRGFNTFSELEIVYLFTWTVIFIVIVQIITNALFKIEQTIWLDSYFDGKNLTPKESWRIAKKLYFPWVQLQWILFYRYYMWVILSGITLFFLWSYVFIFSGLGSSLSENVTFITSILYLIISGIVLVIWTRYLKIKLSYAPFMFLDRYSGKSDSAFWKDFFIELEKLNRVSREESFKKNVMLELGADTAVTLVEFISAIMVGAGVPRIFALAGKEVSYRIVHFAKMTGRYVLYRFAFKAVYGNTHHVNEHIYNL
jgi:hypothetical protein